MIDYEFLTDPTPEQIAEITDLYRAEGWWGDEPDSPAHIQAVLKGSHCFLVAQKDNQIVGMGRAISDRASDAYIQDLTIRSDCRGQGIASKIVRMLVDRLHQDGIFWIALIAEKGSHGFYRTVGFKPMPDALPLRLMD